MPEPKTRKTEKEPEGPEALSVALGYILPPPSRWGLNKPMELAAAVLVTPDGPRWCLIDRVVLDEAAARFSDWTLGPSTLGAHPTVEGLLEAAARLYGEWVERSGWQPVRVEAWYPPFAAAFLEAAKPALTGKSAALRSQADAIDAAVAAGLFPEEDA